MSEEEFLCELCGHYTLNRVRCTHCGQDIAYLFENPSGFRIPVWGLITIRLLEPGDATRVWPELASEWAEWERWTNLGLVPDQLERFNTQSEAVELYCSDADLDKIKKVLQGRGTVEFQELPHDDIPRRPPSKFPRPPYLPKRYR